MNTAKVKIRGLIEDYKKIFPDEYIAFVKQQIRMRDGLINEYAAFPGDEQIERKLFDMPATLHAMLIDKLNKDEHKWFVTKAGGRWFAKSFKEFRASIKI